MPLRQLTHAPRGHILTNANVWSADSKWIIYDTRSDAAGAVFDGTTIERVEVATGRVEILYRSTADACCGVATCSPDDDRVVFILGPENPTADWQYGPSHRQGIVVYADDPRRVERLDARDRFPPFTAGALRGGSHVHTFDPTGRMVAFTYEDAVLNDGRRAVGVSLCDRPVVVPPGDRNHDGSSFSVLVADLTDAPEPGSDQIGRAIEDAWVGRSRSIAFLGEVLTGDGRPMLELFVADLPDDLTVAGDRPIQGTTTACPAPPCGVVQRRLTNTVDRKFPGIQGPRHWPRSDPNGDRIGFLMRDDGGAAQLWTISSDGGPPRQITSCTGVQSAFTWTPSGRHIACVIGGRVCIVGVEDSSVMSLTETLDPPPRPEACVVSPDGSAVAFVRSIPDPDGKTCNQIFVVDLPLAA